MPASSGSPTAATSSSRPVGLTRGASSTRCMQATGSPIAAEALRRIAELYAIETAIRGQTPSRAAERTPIQVAAAGHGDEGLARDASSPASRPAAALADAIRYALEPLGRCFAASSTTAASSSTTTPSNAPSAPVALGRKNHLFAGSDGGADRWATVCSLIATAKLNDVEPFAYLKDVLERLSNGHPMSRLDDLLPWNWAPAIAAAA